MSHALIVMAHPAAAPSLTRAIATALGAGITAAGHGSELVDLAAEGFDPVFSPADHAAYAEGGALPADVVAEQQRIDRADHLILVYPVYWWAMPALLKGWIDRVFVTGWAFDTDAEERIVKKLGRLNVSLVAVAGADSGTYQRRGYRGAMETQIERGVFDFCGAPVVASELITPDQLGTAPADVVRDLAARITRTVTQAP